MLHAGLVKYFKFKSILNISQSYFHKCSILLLAKPYDSPSTKYKNAPVYSFVNNANFHNKTKNRLFVWGYTGMGALGEQFTFC